MTSQAVTPAAIATNVLDPGMDALALQARKRRLIHHPETREADSLTEILAVIAAAVTRVNAIVDELAAANGLQVEPLRTITGWSDRVVTDMRAAERDPQRAAPVSGRKIAREITGLLDEIDAAGPADAAVALTDLFLLFAGTPRDLLFRDAVTYHLGARRTRRLADLHDVYTRRRDRRRAPTPTAA